MQEVIVEESASTLQSVTPVSRPLNRPLHPGWLIVITMVAGLAASGPIVGVTLYRYGFRKMGWFSGLLMGLFGVLILVVTFLWSLEWFWVTLLITGIHLLCAAGIFLILKPRYQRYLHTHPLPLAQRGTLHNVFTGLVGGAFTGCLMGVISVVFYILLIDRLFSTFIPVTFEDVSTGIRVFIMITFLTLSGFIAGGFVGRFKPTITVSQMFMFGLALIWAQLTWLTAMELTVAIPEFQAGAATGGGWESIIAPFILENLFIGFWWSVFLMFFIIAPPGKWRKIGRAAQVIAINLAAGITFCITFGYPADIFLSVGRYLEQNAQPEKALWCYEHGLKKEPQNRIASYLQYRVALLNHKLNDPVKAKNGFKRVVAKYTWNKNLVKKAGRFLDNLERSSGGKRVVLPGVETRTEYKGGYCVPNSLALAMRYWGSDITARNIGKRITGLGSGTFIVNQSWLAEQEGFRHSFLPLAGLNDIKRCIDAGFPTLVYVPAHVFAIFGYDEALDTFITYDVATHDVWVEYLQKDFIKSWKKQATTLVLAYPPDKEFLIPQDIRDRMVRLSDHYLHFQLHFFDAPADSISIPHLLRAAGDSGEFFFPLTILYSDYPGMRKTLSAKFDTEKVSDAIKSYFWDDFDEGIHQAGQYHNERWAWPDWALKFSIQYLIGHERFDLVEALIGRIKQQGKISSRMIAEMGIIDLSRGNLEKGMDRLSQAKGNASPLYVGLAKYQLGDNAGGTREMTSIIKNRTWNIKRKPRIDKRKRNHTDGTMTNPFFNDAKPTKYLDAYGFPGAAVANRILVDLHDFGESRETLENNWEVWIHHIPYDAPVARALERLLRERLARLDKKKNPAAHQRLERKLDLVTKRALRYDMERFRQQNRF